MTRCLLRESTAVLLVSTLLIASGWLISHLPAAVACWLSADDVSHLEGIGFFLTPAWVLLDRHRALDKTVVQPAD